MRLLLTFDYYYSCDNLRHYLARLDHTRNEASPSFRSAPQRWRTKKAMAIAMLVKPTTRYAMPRNVFLPPIQLIVEMTSVFLPAKDCTGNADAMSNVTVEPAGSVFVMRP